MYELLTSREIEVLKLHCDGLKNQTIADRLYVSLSDIKYHMNMIRNKMELRSSQQLVKFAIRTAITVLN